MNIKSVKGIQGVQSYFGALYANDDNSIDYIYGYAARTVGYLCKNISYEKAESIHFIRPISWLFALSNNLNIDVCKTYAQRFPKCCPYCISSPCICFKTGKMPESYIPAYKVKQELDTKYNITYQRNIDDLTLDECVERINEIYPSNEIVWRYAGPWHHFVKMQEEVSEIHEAFSKYAAGTKPIEAVGDEIADTLAWIFGAWNIVFPNRSLDEEIINYYINGCPVCKKAPCECKPHSDRAAELIDVDKISLISIELSKLLEILPSHKEEITELQSSLSSAITTQNEPVTVQAIKQTKESLNAINDTVTTLDGIGKKTSSIITTILAIIAKLSGG